MHPSQTPHLLDAFGQISERQVISPGLEYAAGRPDLTSRLYTDQGQLCLIAIGDIKLHTKWSYNRWKSLSLDGRIDFRQVLTQTNDYMSQRKCRYSIAITEAECVAIYRVPGYNGWLKLSDPFPVEWTESIAGGGSEVLTANIALVGLSLWAQWAADAHKEEEEEYAELDNDYPEQPSSSPMPSFPPEFLHPTSDYLPSSQ